MTEVETLLSDAAFARPTSLHMPERVVQSALIDSSSYTPFPSFPGSSRARDPFGLNAFLLPPDDKSWHYIDPSPAPGLVAADPAGHLAPVAGPSTIKRGAAEAPQLPHRQSSLRKQRSMSMFHRPSPLGQPPLELPPVQRRRSNSVGSQNSVKEDEDDEATRQARQADDDFAPGAASSAMATSRSRNGQGLSASSKKTLKTSLFKASKSMFRISDASAGPIPRAAQSAPPSPTASSSSSSTGPAAERHSDYSTDASAAAKGTPKSSRSNSTFSTLSSASSVSSEGPHTPSETPADGQEVAVAGEKLADALAGAAAADAAADKRKGWKSWLGGNKRATKSVVPAASSPLSRSPADSPASSKIDLIGPPSGSAVEDEQTPSRVATPPSRSLTGSPSGLAHSWVGESLRRASLRKVQALRRPSPHPLAMHIRRQHCPLPDEVAFSLQAGLRMFPKSVNAPSSVMTPNQGGLATTLAIKSVLRALDAGRLPVGLLSARRSSVENPTGNVRPKGITDFIRRPPFEDRMMVFYPDGRYSPISTARPGFALWDLDFSAYIQALAELDKPFSRRPSTIGGSEHFRSQGAVSPGSLLVPPPMVDEVDGPIADDGAEVLVTPPLDGSAGSLLLAQQPSPSEIVQLDPEVSEGSVAYAATETQTEHPEAGSSFRKSRAQPVTWLDSSESESSDEDEDEDDAPLSRPRMSRSTTGRDLKTRTSSWSDRPEGRPSAALPRSSSTTAVDLLAPAPRRSIEYARPDGTLDKRRSYLPASQSTGQLWDVKRKQDALDEVVRARERRVANNAGEAEKRAEAETRTPLRSAMKGGRSSAHVDVSPAPSSPERGDDVRRKSRSTFEPAAVANRSPKRGSAEGGRSPSSRRYHSFYDLPAVSGTEAISRTPPRPVVAPLPQFRHTQSYPVPVYGHHPAYHPGFVLPAPVPTVAPVLPHSGSMRFPSTYGQFPQHSLPTLAPAPGYLPHSASMGSLALSLGPPGDRRSAHRSTRAS